MQKRKYGKKIISIICAVDVYHAEAGGESAARIYEVEVYGLDEPLE